MHRAFMTLSSAPGTIRDLFESCRSAGIGVVVFAFLAGCGGPDDGVLSYRFGVYPMSTLVLPSEEQLGRELRPTDFESTEGICSADVEAGSLIMTVEHLPPITTSLDGPYYQAFIEMSDRPIGVQAQAETGVGISSGAIAGPGRSGPVGSSAAAAKEVPLGRITPNPQGSASLTLARAPFDLSYVSGARIEIIVPDSSRALTFPVLAGEVGNLLEEGEDPTPPVDDGGGHHH